MSKSKRRLLVAGICAVGLLAFAGARRAAQPERDRPAILHGQVELAFKVGKQYSRQRVKYPADTFDGRPVVLVSESGSAGTFVILKAEHLEENSFMVTGFRHPPSVKKPYRCQAGWIAIGDPVE